MANEIDIQNYYKVIEEASTNEEKLILMVLGIKKLYPINNVYFFRFSPIGYYSEGVIYIDHLNEVTSIKYIHDDLRSLPTILTAIKNRKAVYLQKRSIFTHNEKIPGSSIAASMIILPVCQSSNVIGYIISTKFENNNLIDEKLLLSLTTYGKSFGKLLEREYNYYPTSTLSNREIQVMQSLAHGSNVKEIADTLGISEHTVKEYIRTAVRKLNARNRLHAVVILIRKGLIS